MKFFVDTAKIEDIKKYVSEDDVKETIKARNTVSFPKTR